MQNSFYLAFSVVFPLFLMMVLGYVLRRIGLFQDAFLRQLNQVCFQVFLPVILFWNVYSSDFSQVFRPRLVVFGILCILAMFLLLMITIPVFEKNDSRRGVLIQGMFRSNFILFGIPVAESLFGVGHVGVTAVLIAFVVPLFNVLAVIALEVFRGGRADIGRICRGIATNPLILGALLAVICVLVGLKLPQVLEKTVQDIAGIATPLALIVLGGSFQFASLGKNAKALFWAVSGKLIFLPVLFLSGAILIGFRGTELGALFIMLASPTAVSSFTMAQQMSGDDELAGQIVVMSSLFSILTVFCGIFMLSQQGLLAA